MFMGGRNSRRPPLSVCRKDVKSIGNGSDSRTRSLSKGSEIVANCPCILQQGIIILRLIVIEERAADDPSHGLEEKVLLDGIFKSLGDVVGRVLIKSACHNGHQFLPLGMVVEKFLSMKLKNRFWKIL